MARSRNIKPALFKNDVLAECDMMTRLLFIGLWTLADCDGRLEDRPKRIAIELFPYDSDREITRGLSALFERGFIDRYEVDGVSIIQVINFDKHQNPHKNEKPSGLPENDGSYTVSGSQDLSSNYASAQEKDGTNTLPIRPIKDSFISDSLLRNDDSGASEKPQKPLAAVFTPPSEIDASDWKDYEEHRKKIRKPMTVRARNDVCKNITRCAEYNGVSTGDVIGHAIQAGWTGIGQDWRVSGNKVSPEKSKRPDNTALAAKVAAEMRQGAGQ